jgi:hypothetical protein
MKDAGSEIGLMPIDIKTLDGQFYIASAKLPKDNFKEPFFIDSLSRRFHIADVDKIVPGEQDMLVRPLHYDEGDARIELAPLGDFAKVPIVEPRDETRLKFVFHMSRCGSTLATQMMATSDRFFVVPEPPIVNALLDPSLVLPEGINKMELFKSIVHAIEDCKPERAEYTIVKFRSWNTLFIDEILQQFPDNQWMFVHRNGVEVLESVLRDPPGWMRSRHSYAAFFADKLEMSTDELNALSESEYAIRVLGAFCKEAAQQKSPRSHYLEYSQIAQSLPEILNKNWKLGLSDLEKEAEIERTKIYSKDPEKMREFSPDSEMRRRAATEQEKLLARQFVESQRELLTNTQFDWTKEFRPKMS